MHRTSRVNRLLAQCTEHQWLHNGDMNSAFFHRLHSVRASRASISGASISATQVGDSYFIVEAGIGNDAVAYYETLFKEDVWSIELLRDCWSIRWWFISGPTRFYTSWKLPSRIFFGLVNVTKKGFSNVERARCCAPTNEGGFCIRSIRLANAYFLYKLTWDVLFNDGPSTMIRDWYFTEDGSITNFRRA